MERGERMEGEKETGVAEGREREREVLCLIRKNLKPCPKQRVYKVQWI